jgi:uncharacterized membrane protein HdeD (DUF308 family)
MNAENPIDKRTLRGIYLVAAVSALAPFVVQTATLVATRSSAWTLLAGLALAAVVAAAALAFQARQAGGWGRLTAGSITGIVLAVVAYHAIAFPVAHIIQAMFFAARPS